MKREIGLGLIAVVVVAVFLGIVKYFQIAAAMAQHASMQPPPDAITSSMVREEQWQELEQVSGELRSVQGALLRAEVSGVIASVSLSSGSVVRKGDLILSLDTSVEEADLLAAKAQLERARRAEERQLALFERQATSKDQYEAAQADLRTAKAVVASVEARMAKKRIVAPFDGRLGVRQVVVGDYVAEGAPLVSLESLDQLYVHFNVPQRRIPLLEVASPLQVSGDGISGSVTGKVVAIDSRVNELTRSVEVQGIVENRSGELRSGMFVSVALSLGEPKPTLTIPTSAVNFAPFGDSVFVISATETGSTVNPVQVRLGERRGDRVVVLEGVGAGQQVATSGLFKLRPGAAVFVNNELAPSESLSPEPNNT